MKSPNTIPLAVELNPNRSGQTHFNRPGTGPGCKNTEPGRILTIPHFPIMVCPLKSADAKSGKVV